MKHIVTISLFAALLYTQTISCCKAHKNMPGWTRLALVAVGANPNYGDSVRKYLISKLFLIFLQQIENRGQPLDLDWEVMRIHGLKSKGHNCYQAIRDRGFDDLSPERKRMCQDLAKVRLNKISIS